MSALYDILTQCVALSKSTASGGPFLDLAGEGSSRDIKDDAIQAISWPYHKDGNRGWMDALPKPGVYFVPMGITEPPEGGTDNYAYAYYSVMCQILDPDATYLDSERFKSRIKWEQELRRFFATGNLRNTVNSTTTGIVETTYVKGVDLSTTRRELLLNDVVFALNLVFKVQEGHDTDGRV